MAISPAVQKRSQSEPRPLYGRPALLAAVRLWGHFAPNETAPFTAIRLWIGIAGPQFVNDAIEWLGTREELDEAAFCGLCAEWNAEDQRANARRRR